MSIRDEYHKKSEEIRNKQVALMNPSHEESIILLDREVGRVQKGHVFDMPLGRVTVTGKVTDQPYEVEHKSIGKKEPFEVEIRYVTVRTNAFAITQYVELCQVCAGNIRKCLSLSQLKETLDGLQSELGKINLEPVEVRIAENQIQKVNPNRISDVAFVTSQSIRKL